MSIQLPGIHINQLMCCEIPGDEPIVKFINVLDPLKMPPGVAVTKDGSAVKIQITNNCHKMPRGFLSKIEVFNKQNDKEPKWETYLGSSIRCVAANRKKIVACCEDLSINCYDLKSEDLVSSLSISQEGHCLVLTKTGLLHMWHLEDAKNIISRVSVRSLLSGKGTISCCSLSSSNQPVITLSDGRAYAYSMELQTWLQLSNPLDPVSGVGGELRKKVSSMLPLASIQKSMPVHRNANLLPPGVLLSFLESQIMASSVLQSATEYKHWLLAAVNHLLEKGPECRLRVILDDLVRAQRSSSKHQGEHYHVVGVLFKYISTG
nr:unnamed protein product [Callosobruchus analis]